MRDLLKLICFVLGPNCKVEAAQAIEQKSRDLNVDVLTYLPHHCELSDIEVYERAAAYCDLAFSPRVPAAATSAGQLGRIDELGKLRSLNMHIYDRKVLFLAPSAEQMLTLSSSTSQILGRLNEVCVVPPHALRSEIVKRCSAPLLDNARQRLAGRWSHASAHLDLSIGLRLVFVSALVFLVAIAAFAPLFLAPVLVPFLTILFLPPAWFRLVALYESGRNKNLDAHQLLDDASLPAYSVLIPLRDESEMVPQLALAMQALDYPPEKLDIKFVVEATSKSTLTEVRKILDDPRFELIDVPEALPHTKPKALNYALPLVRGHYVVVYDAEDIPEPDQLRRAATVFSQQLSVDCLQAELVIDNADENWLTALFATEYSGLFGVMLPALSAWNLPMPLGGTSNHFRVQALRELGGWDAFNVTEDADLGIRMSRLRYRVGTLASRTYEEAPVSLSAWMGQRTRWMKGWMQTFIVHNRYAGNFFKDAGWLNFLAFQIYVGGMIFTAPLHAVFVIVFGAKTLVNWNSDVVFVDVWTFSYLFLFFAGYTGATALSIAGAIRLKRIDLLGYQLLLPVYWILTGAAAFRAAYELLVRPYFWSKTSHGVTRRQRHPITARKS